MKNIVLCSDGTGNSGGKGRGTNVWRLHNAVDLNVIPPGHTHRQITFYDDGVGTDSWRPLKLIGGAFGWGLARNVKELYTFLVRNYDPGASESDQDQIYLFGFSRGAFTVRCLGGMIARCGLLVDAPPRELGDRVDALYRLYRQDHRLRRRDPSRRASTLSATRFERMMARYEARCDAFGLESKLEAFPRHARTPRIRCIGVWDTVDAVGVPFDELRKLLNALTATSFHTTNLATNVDYGYHALAVDDERQTFRPVMWDEQLSARTAEEAGVDQHIEQVWFAGAHSNVGGGYPKQGMSYVTLRWMMERVERCGLVFEPGALDAAARSANVHDKLYDSRAGAAAYYRYQPRAIGGICQAEGRCPPRIHYSVIQRIDGGTLGYAPANLPTGFEAEIVGHIDAALPPTRDGLDRTAANIRSRLADPESLPTLARGAALVGRRRGLYRAFLGSTLGALAAVAALRAWTAPEPVGRVPGWVIGAINWLLPEPLQGMAATITETVFHNWLAVIATAAFVTTFGVVWWVSRRTQAEMRRAFQALWTGGRPYLVWGRRFARRAGELSVSQTGAHRRWITRDISRSGVLIAPSREGAEATETDPSPAAEPGGLIEVQLSPPRRTGRSEFDRPLEVTGTIVRRRGGEIALQFKPELTTAQWNWVMRCFELAAT